MMETGAGRSKKIDTFLKEKLKPRFFKFWMDFTSQFPLPFHKPSSSTGKYHRDADGKTDSLENHTLEMLIVADKVISLFGESREDQLYDLVMLAIALHDISKYGVACERKHTTKEHGVIASKSVLRDGKKFGLTSEESHIISEMVANHDGRFSSRYPTNDPIVLNMYEAFVFFLDMCSSRRVFNVLGG